MLTWMSDVFADNSDKARLIAVLTTGAIAIFVFFANQHFATRKARKELLIKKIEELYQSAISYERNARALLKAIHRGGCDESGFFTLDPMLVDAMNYEVENLGMLMGLYFPSVEFKKEQYYAGPTLPIMEIVMKNKRVAEDEAVDASHQSRDNINSNVDALKIICTTLMKKHCH